MANFRLSVYFRNACRRLIPGNTHLPILYQAILPILFYCRFQLNQHLESANIQVSQWPCSKCDHQTVSHQALYDHDRLVHQKGLFKCAFPLCSKLRQSRQDIVLHFDSSHSTANK